MDAIPLTRGHYLILASFYVTFNFASADLKLYGKVSRCAGRVEFNNGTTSARVCSNNWDLNDAKVLCRQLKCGEAVGAGVSSFGSGTGSSWLFVVSCGDVETKCKHLYRKASSCSGGDAAVVCSVYFPKPDVSKQPAGAVTWGDNSTIKCSVPDQIHQLTQGQFKLNSKELKSLENNIATFDLSKVTFEDEGQYECCYQTQQPMRSCTSVNINVDVQLQTPNISVSSPDELQQSALQVTKGYSFVIRCSTPPQSPEGLFILLSTNKNTTQSSVNHSASFYFTEARSEDQGEYICVYQVTGAGRTYTSPQSPAVTVIVKPPLLPVILPVVAVILLLLVLIGVYIFYRRRKRRRHDFQLSPISNQTPMSARNQYEDSDEEEDEEDEADYVNVPSATEIKPMDVSESEEEPDYVNVNEPTDVNIPDIYGGDDSIYQNY